MPNPYLVTLSIPSGNESVTYDLRDAGARTLIDDLLSLIKELMNFTEYLGVTTTEIDEGSTTNPVTIGGESVTAIAGNVVTRSSDNKEFIYSSTGIWQSFGQLSGLGDLAFKDTASATYTPQGSISGTTLGTKNITQLKTTGTLPTCTMPTFVVNGTNLTITDGSYVAGTLPTGESVAVGDGTVTTQGTFTGTEATITVS